MEAFGATPTATVPTATVPTAVPPALRGSAAPLDMPLITQQQQVYLNRIVDGMTRGDIGAVAEALQDTATAKVEVPDQFLDTVKRWMEARPSARPASARPSSGLMSPPSVASPMSPVMTQLPGSAGGLPGASAGTYVPTDREFLKLRQRLEDAIARNDEAELQKILIYGSQLAAARGGPATPLLGAMTPGLTPAAVSGAQTPMLQGFAGSLGGMTPGMTPLALGAQTPTVGMTPLAYGAVTPALPAATPRMAGGTGGMTPELGGSTPVPPPTLLPGSGGATPRLAQGGMTPTVPPTVMPAQSRAAAEARRSLPHKEPKEQKFTAVKKDEAPLPAYSPTEVGQDPFSTDPFDTGMTVPTPAASAPNTPRASKKSSTRASRKEQKDRDRRRDRQARRSGQLPDAGRDDGTKKRNKEDMSPHSMPSVMVFEEAKPVLSVAEVADWLRTKPRETALLKQISSHFKAPRETLRRLIEAETSRFNLQQDKVTLREDRDPNKKQAINDFCTELVRSHMTVRQIMPNERVKVSIHQIVDLAFQAVPHAVARILEHVAKATLKKSSKSWPQVTQRGTYPANMALVSACIIDRAVMLERKQGRPKHLEAALGPCIFNIIFSRWVLGVMPGSNFLANLLLTWERLGYFRARYIDQCKRKVLLLTAYARKEGVPDEDKEKQTGWYSIVQRAPGSENCGALLPTPPQGAANRAADPVVIAGEEDEDEKEEEAAQGGHLKAPPAAAAAVVGEGAPEVAPQPFKPTFQPPSPFKVPGPAPAGEVVEPAASSATPVAGGAATTASPPRSPRSPGSPTGRSGPLATLLAQSHAERLGHSAAPSPRSPAKEEARVDEGDLFGDDEEAPAITATIPAGSVPHPAVAAEVVTASEPTVASETTVGTTDIGSVPSQGTSVSRGSRQAAGGVPHPQMEEPPTADSAPSAQPPRSAGDGPAQDAPTAGSHGVPQPAPEDDAASTVPTVPTEDAALVKRPADEDEAERKRRRTGDAAASSP